MLALLRPYMMWVYIAIAASVFSCGFAGGFWIRGIGANHAAMGAQADALASQKRSAALIREMSNQRVDMMAAIAITKAHIDEARNTVDEMAHAEELEYVQTTASRRPALPNAGVRVLNIAAARGVPKARAAATGAYDPSGGVAGNTLVSITRANYRICAKNADRLVALQDWVRADYVAGGGK